MEEEEATKYKKSRGAKSRSDKKKKEDLQQHRKPRKYHEECFAVNDNKPTERRIRYRDDDKAERFKPTAKPDENVIPRNDKLKRKPRVEDVQRSSKVEGSNNFESKSQQQNNCYKYDGSLEEERRKCDEKTGKDNKRHIKKKSDLVANDEENLKSEQQTRRRSCEDERRRLPDETQKVLHSERTKHHTRRRASKEQTKERHNRNKEEKSVTTREMGKSDKSKKSSKGREVYDETRHRGDTRRCLSDSEIDQTRTNIKHACARRKSADDEEEVGTNDKDSEEKQIDVAALYKFFYKEESRRGSKENDDKLHPNPKRNHRNSKDSPKQNRENIDSTPKRNGEKPSIFLSRNRQNPDQENPDVSKQSSIRGKLIRVLFKRVKDLLKETEQLRDERKDFMERINKLSSQVTGLQMKEEEHITSEWRIRERLNVIANDIDVTEKGTSFREEIQSILDDIQSKYASYWRHHEQNIQKVQTQAGDQLQSLMNNVVGKYIKLSELQQQQHTATSSTSSTTNNITPGGALDRNKISSTAVMNYPAEICPSAGYHLNPEASHMTVPAGFSFVNQYDESKMEMTGGGGEYSHLYGKNVDTNQHVTDSISITMDNSSSTSTMDTVLQNTKYQQLEAIPQKYTNNTVSSGSNGNRLPVRYMRPLYIDTGLDRSVLQPVSKPSGENLLKIAEPQQSTRLPQQRNNTATSSNHFTRTEAPQRQQELDTRDTKDQSNHFTRTEAPQRQQQLDTKDTKDQQQTPLLDQVEKLKTKEELKEFWRHKLLQPNPLDVLRKEKENKLNLARSTNHQLLESNSQDSEIVYGRNQF